MSTYYNFWRMCYLNRYVTDAQLIDARNKGIITQAEYETILSDALAQNKINQAKYDTMIVA